MKPKIIISYPAPQPVIDEAHQKFEIITTTSAAFSTDQIIDEANKSKVFAIVVTPSQKMTSAVIGKLPTSVKVIATSSVGFDHLDLAAAREKNIILTNTPDVLTDCTADFAMLLLLAACRRLPEYESIMQKGWGRILNQNETLGVQVTGKTLGILGMGRIGRAVAARARGFGMKILYSNTKRLPADLEEGATYYKNFRDMLPHCAVLSLHAPGNASTEKIMNAETFALLPKKSVFINIARGSLVDEEALMAALKSGHIFSAGLDVFLNEPNINKRFNELPNVVLSPHMGSATLETRVAMGHLCLENITNVLEGRVPKTQIL